MKRSPRSRLAGARLLAAVAAVTLTACGASGRPAPAATAARQGVVLMRTYYLALRPDVKLGKAHPSLTDFGYAGLIPGGQDGKSQLAALSQRFETDLGFQFSDTTAIQPGHDATLGMGFGEQIEVTIGNLTPATGGILEANFGFRFGKREVLKRTLPFKPDEAVLFAGHLDASLPILSVFTLEIRLFPPGQEKEMQEFLQQARRDRQDFAPPLPPQRDQEPFIPGVGGVSMPELIASPRAVYPEGAKGEKLDGQVIVEVTVDHQGNATDPRVISSSLPVFEPPAVEAAKGYRYKPAMRDGKPVSVTMNLIMIFRFTARPSP